MFDAKGMMPQRRLHELMPNQMQDWRAMRPRWQGFEGTRPEFREARQDWRSQRPNLRELVMQHMGRR